MTSALANFLSGTVDRICSRTSNMSTQRPISFSTTCGATRFARICESALCSAILLDWWTHGHSKLAGYRIPISGSPHCGLRSHLLGGELERQTSREALERRLWRTVKQQWCSRRAARGRDGAHVDNGALHSRLQHALHHHLWHVNRRVHVERELAALRVRLFTLHS